MNPATPVAVESAVNTLFQSIFDENRAAMETMSTTCSSSYRGDVKTLDSLRRHAKNHAEAVKSTLYSVQRHLLEKISALHTEQNEMVPLHQLPIEIFIRIITGALGPLRNRDGPYLTRSRHLFALGQVCKHWKKVIEGTSSFWSTINILDPQAIISTAISRSGGHPLDIIAISTSYHTRRRRSSIWFRSDEFTDTVITLSTRWRSVRMRVTSPEKALAIMNAPAPLLQTLELESSEPIQVGFPEGGTAFQGTEPPLRRLRLENIAISGDSYPLRRLRSLIISGGYRFTLSCEEILGVLRTCSGLVELNLSLNSTATVEGPSGGTPFALGELQSLSISLSPSCTLTLLETIRFPSVQTVFINLNFNPSSDHLFSKLIQHTQALFRVVFKAQYKLLIGFSLGDCLHWTCEPREVSRNQRNFKITARNSSVMNYTKYLVENLLRQFPAEVIEIHFDGIGDLFPYLEAFDGIHGIKHVVASTCDLNSILDYMSGPTTGDQWGFPDLEGLNVSYCAYDWERLLYMVEARYGIGEEEGRDVSDDRPDLPPPLKCVTIRQFEGEIDGVDVNSLKFLEDIFGSDCVIFDEDEGMD